MDNASIHKRESCKKLLSEHNFDLMFLPAYSPQLNPIEEVFSKWKHIIKTANCETLESLKSQIQVASEAITRTDCNNFFSHVREFVLKGIRREEF